MMFLGTYIDNRMKAIVRFIVRVVERFGNAVFTAALSMLLLFVIFWLSLFLHLAFVHTFLPIKTFKWPVHLAFSNCDDRPGLCSNPAAVIALDGNIGYGSGDFFFFSDDNLKFDDQPRMLFGAGKHFRNKKKSRKSKKASELYYGESFSDEDFLMDEFNVLLDDPRTASVMTNKQHQNAAAAGDGLGQSCSKSNCNGGGASADDGSVTTNKIFARGQSYGIIMQLEMPDSESNKILGMFQVEISIHDRQHRIISSSQRPVLLPYRSAIQQFASNLLRLPTLLFNDYYSETHTLRVPLYEAYVDDPTKSAQYLKLAFTPSPSPLLLPPSQRPNPR